MKRIIILLIISASFHVTFLLTAEAVRPLNLNTQDTETVAPGELEMEISYEYTDQTDEETNLSLILTTGITGSIDVSVDIPYLFVDKKTEANRNGFSDISFTTKWNFLKEGERLPSTTLGFTYQTKSGDVEKSLGSGESEYQILSIFTKTFDDFSLSVNLGYTFIEHSDDTLDYGLAGEWEVMERLSLIAEIFGDNNLKDSFDQNATSALLGFSYDLSENTSFDMNVTRGISESEPDFEFTTGFTFLFK